MLFPHISLIGTKTMTETQTEKTAEKTEKVGVNFAKNGTALSRTAVC